MAEEDGRPEDAALLRDYAAGVPYAILADRHDARADALRHRVARWRARLAARERGVSHGSGNRAPE